MLRRRAGLWRIGGMGYLFWVVRRIFSALLGRFSQEGVWVSGSSFIYCINFFRLENQYMWKCCYVRCQKLFSVLIVLVIRGRFVFDVIWYLNVFVFINFVSQFKFIIEIFRREQTFQESVEQTLVKFIVYAFIIDGLGY